MRSAPIRQDTVNEVSATRLADADGGRRSVAPFRLVRYTAAASAAASAAALGSAANATIVTGGTVSTGVFPTPAAPSSSMAPPVLTTPLDKGDFGNALNVKFSVVRNIGERRLRVARDGSTGSFQFLRTSSLWDVSRRNAVGLAYGDAIQANPGSSREWANSALLARSVTSGTWFGVSGSWRLASQTPNSDQHYLAFRFRANVSSSYQYGWMDVTWWGRQTDGDVELTINGWAYNTAGSITAGFSGTAVPSGGGVLALAGGAAGLRGRRRGRN
ncbi:MAG: hypothetical protein ACO4CI_09755 [Phycisphaerales bacterium]